MNKNPNAKKSGVLKSTSGLHIHDIMIAILYQAVVIFQAKKTGPRPAGKKDWVHVSPAVFKEVFSPTLWTKNNITFGGKFIY